VDYREILISIGRGSVINFWKTLQSKCYYSAINRMHKQGKKSYRYIIAESIASRDRHIVPVR